MAKGILDDKRVLALISAAGNAHPILIKAGETAAAYEINQAIAAFAPEFLTADDIAVISGKGAGRG